MKTTLTILSFLLLTLATTSFPGAVDAQAVIDMLGNKVLTGVSYNIYTPPFGNNTITGATLRGIHVVFSPDIKVAAAVDMSSPFDSKYSPVLLDTNLHFKVGYSPISNISTTWGVSLSALIRQFAVAIGGDESDYFKIAKYEGYQNVYKLLYCPRGREFCQCSCVEVGHHSWHGLLFMTPNSGQALPIVFKPVVVPSISPKV